MKIQEFWNAAFLAALTRVAPEDAERQATEATKRAIEFWQVNRERRGLPISAPLWKDQDIDLVPLTGDDLRELTSRSQLNEPDSSLR